MARQHTQFFYTWKQCVKIMFETGVVTEGLVVIRCDHGCWHPWSTLQLQQRADTTDHTLKQALVCLNLDSDASTWAEEPLSTRRSKVCRITVAVAVLHNMCIAHGVPTPADCVPVHDRGRIGSRNYIGPINEDLTARNRLVNGRFAR